MAFRPGADADVPHDGSRDVARAIARLARRLPEPLQPLATIAYNYRWSWTPDGRELFRALGAHRFTLANENPVRFLRDLLEPDLLAAATDGAYLDRVERVAAELTTDLARPDQDLGPGGPIAFLCAEFGVHRSLPVYSGGLGVLAGDLLKEASDQALPFLGVGLLYRRGYFHQRMDLSGWQQEYWIESDPNVLPAVRVTGSDGAPLTITVPIWDGELSAHVWRCDVGRVPLYLLDAEIGENSPLQRWVTARLYEGNRSIRLAQYALLGVGAVRALEKMGIAPSLYHLNEGHAALATLAVAAQEVGDEPTHCGDAIERARRFFVFTTHTPVPAGNEVYGREEVLSVLGRLFWELNFDPHEVLALGRTHTASADEGTGLTPLAIRGSRSTNAVSQRHGVIARAMWHEMFPLGSTDDVPISHVTNAVHLPTWMAPPMRELLTETFGEGWERHASDPIMWKQVDDIEDQRLWDVRCTQREQLVYAVRRKVVVDRLSRGEDIDFVQAAREAFDETYLTVGFARRLATYKRLNLLVHNAERALALLDHDRPLQFVFAGKAHPLDDAAKAFAQRMFDLKRVPEVGNKVVFLEDYDLSAATTAVAGCDVWLNLPRPPLEASGTSGMKAALNGCLNLSVLDGWWMEAYDGTNGWAIDGSVDPDESAKDERDAQALYDLVDNEVKPLFYDRGPDDVPTGWLERVRASLRTLGPRFCGARMLDDYVRQIYRR
ncbi:MAG TPA: alpha-glucan family phosphorylase [Acidimicrobiales bacterium]|jgi:starch phosphorylase|nr:alpha-glucan family phosphorylase [Acidimicrobiales bacterium]